MGEGSDAPGGVFDHGTPEEDGPVTWEALIFPANSAAIRSAGQSSPTCIGQRLRPVYGEQLGSR